MESSNDNRQRIRQIEDEIEALKRALHHLGSLPLEQDRLNEILTEKLRELRNLISETNRSQASINFGEKSQIGDVSIQEVVGGNKTVHYNFMTLDEEALVREYLHFVYGAANSLSISDMDSSDPGKEPLRLVDVYTPLEVGSTVKISSNEDSDAFIFQRTRQFGVIEVINRNSRLVLLGSPGSGKSTITNYISLSLARTFLYNSISSDADEASTQFLLKPLIPIRVSLKSFAGWLKSHLTKVKENKQGNALLFWAWLTQTYDKDIATVLRRRILSGEAILFFDGLDEVPDDPKMPVLPLIIQVIQSLSHVSGSSKLVVTCRILDYNFSDRQLMGWPTETIINLSSELARQFVDRWFSALSKLNRPVNGVATDLCAELQIMIVEKPELRDLSGNPLLLTIMTLLQAYFGRLPNEKVRLYEQCIEFLLYRWRPRQGEQSLGKVLKISSWGPSKLNRLLDRIAFSTQERMSDSSENSEADLPRQELIEAVREFFVPFGKNQSYSRTEEFVNYISRYSNGVIQQSGPDTYKFPHRTFQEYLAARWLVSDDSWPSEIGEFFERAMHFIDKGVKWREVILLAVGYQVNVANQVSSSVMLAENLLYRSRKKEQNWTEYLILAGEIFAEIGIERLIRGRWKYTEVRLELLNALRLLLAMQNEDKSPLLMVGDRIRAAKIIGTLEEVEPSGVDPREPVWCYIPAGAFILGSSEKDPTAFKHEQPQKKVALSAFYIAQHPVTNSEWRLFIENGGYETSDYWSDAGWKTRKILGWTAPLFWNDPRFNGYNQPVVGISWYEATAYCNWLSFLTLKNVRLPSEAEWEKSARGTDNRIYPWGDVFDATLANTASSNLTAPSPIGCYSNGASPFNVHDMSGNVYEWTATPWQDSYKDHEGKTYTTKFHDYIVIRGGAWSDQSWFARCTYRNKDKPVARYFDLGLRLCFTPVDDSAMLPEHVNEIIVGAPPEEDTPS